MSDYIKREIIADRLEKIFLLQSETARTIAETLPASDVVERKHGKWKASSEDLIICTSCKCGFLLPYPNRIEEAKTVYGWNFCTNCGAQMDGDSDV